MDAMRCTVATVACHLGRKAERGLIAQQQRLGSTAAPSNLQDIAVKPRREVPASIRLPSAAKSGTAVDPADRASLRRGGRV